MNPIPPLQVGSLVTAKRASGVCDTGERGACYEVYALGGRPRWLSTYQFASSPGITAFQ